MAKEERPDASADDSHARALSLRIAVLGAVAALGGSLIGGLVTWLVTHESVVSERDAVRRAERRDAYAMYYGDAAALATRAALDARLLVPQRGVPRTSPVERDRLLAELDRRAEELAKDQALVVLLGPKRVSDAAFALDSADRTLRDAITAQPYDDEERLVAQHKTASALNTFAVEAKRDLGIPIR